ncbi:ABC1 family protein [Verticillium alfalfae VaMs.102]|uniref:ABC1 family protein n=1 Tax=Verticillium alfalfae (strain VaMs.102 / ATCC MYA-4576 / FGSC 10136) TaxID=526221 RepID=C9S6Q3_VERA1|nr:ABC1 family protein [Verticillium alfalfae VaMs.102]EEY14544.1 ABC1 family protein [Verticillium alfalfae VaMs.102]
MKASFSAFSLPLRRLNTRPWTPGWTCATCRTQLSRPKSPQTITFRAKYSSRAWTKGRPNTRNGRKGVLLLASTGGAATAGVLAFTDDIKYGYDAAERAGRVAAALAVCINDYRTTLNQRDSEYDEDIRSKLLSDCHTRCARRTLKVLEKNGGIFIKLGQHLSGRLPLSPLKTNAPSRRTINEHMFRKDTGQGILDFFSEFSLEQSALRHWLKFTFSMLKRFFPEYDLEWLSSEMDVSLPKELDFTEEAENARRTQQHFARLPEHPLVVPDVLWAKQRILVMARESGHRLDDLEYLDANGIDRDEVSACLARVFNEMIFGSGAPLHCDPHGGNLAIRKNDARGRRVGGHNFDIILYDHGLYREIPRDLQRSYAKMWLAVIDGDMDRMRRYAKEVAHITDEQFPIFASAITGRDFGILSGKNASDQDGKDAGASILQTRTADEKKEMGDALSEGLLADLVQLLGQVPRIILLILKTNDLTRALDENLHTRQGPIRTFMILARYCTRTVFEEQVEELKKQGSLFWPPNTIRLAAAWVGFLRVEIKLEAFELWLSVKRALGWKNAEFAGPGL